MTVVLLQGDVNLPSEQDMMADITQKKFDMSQRYVTSKRHTIQVDYLPFMDELAKLAGNKPNFGTLLKLLELLLLGLL